MIDFAWWKIGWEIISKKGEFCEPHQAERKNIKTSRKMENIPESEKWW